MNFANIWEDHKASLIATYAIPMPAARIRSPMSERSKIAHGEGGTP